MLNAVVLTALAVTPCQAGDLKLENVRPTYGPLGAVREDPKLLPGDHVFLTFDIEGITADADGKVKYRIVTEVLNAENKRVYKDEPRDQQIVNALGGTSMPGYAQLDLGLNSPPGTYTVQVTVTDLATNRSGSLSRKFEVAKPAFGLVRVTTTADVDGETFQSVYPVGGSLWVNFGVVGFARDKAKGQPNVQFELRVLDDTGKPTLAKPFQGTVEKDIPEKAMLVPGQFLVGLNRPGRFVVQLKATDKVSGQTAEVSFPITVVPAATK
jgi:hypothetical protein